MANPANGDPPQPAHVDDFNEMPNDGNPYNDHGGVHYNSGIPNHAYYLMVQGDRPRRRRGRSSTAR